MVAEHGFEDAFDAATLLQAMRTRFAEMPPSDPGGN